MYLIDKERELLSKLHVISDSLSFTDNNNNNKKLNHFDKLREYDEVESNLNEIWAKIELMDPEYVSLRRGVPMEWKAIRLSLE